ncbi:VPS27 (YNR006W) [Zygosaccharomyces parabailii]|nr:VPS27 (YNR006W) [Zygosaccharomyces parabailii]CDH14328.1 related to Vacuolar protein sorting-associated protein 27 [Zygosaccharomyces bailii ISA1307]
MSATSIGELESLIEKATSESIPHGELDLPVALEVSDVVRSRRLAPKECMRCLKKRAMSTGDNPNAQLSSWRLIDICIKNGGLPFIKEICSREFMDTMEHAILKNADNPEVESLLTRILYELYCAFRNDLQLSYVKRVYDKLVARGVEFPRELQDGSSPMAMFDSRTPADWVDSDACMICSKKFSFLTRRHHCRSCGGVFCQEHTSKTSVLPDLGIYEPVRVCDNCYEDYEARKHSTGGNKKKHHSKKKKSKSPTYDEDEELRKAIELSLRESRGSNEPIVPVMASRNPTPPPAIIKEEEALEEEDDPDLKAAIAASLAEAEEEKRKREIEAQQQQLNVQQHQWEEQQRQRQEPQHPSFDLTSAEEEDIHLFASLVERMKNQSATEILEDTQLQRLYQKVLGSRPKINQSLNDSVQKYNSLIDMNTKISDIMNIYDDLLERQLQSINLSERYTVPQGPSDPYTYYEEISYRQPQTERTRAPSAKQTDSARQHHLDEIRDLQMSAETAHTAPVDSSNMLLEIPYPTTEEEMESQASIQGYVPSQKTTQEPRGHGETPYPVEEEEPRTTVKSKGQITNFNFPTVPTRKVLQENSEEESQEVESIGKTEQTLPKEEELLIEL